MQNIITNYLQNHDFEQFAKEIALFFKIDKISDEIEYYLKLNNIKTDCGYIQSFDKTFLNFYTYKKLFSKNDDNIFPMIQIGGDGSGNDFWLDLASARIISLHHDATFYEIASDIYDYGKAFCASFVARGSQLTLKQLLDFYIFLQLEPENSIDELNCIRILKLLKKATNWDDKILTQKLDRLPMEFVYSKVRDFLDQNGIAKMSKADKKIDKINAGVSKLDLSDCFLTTLTFDLPIELEDLNLSNNNFLKLNLELESLIHLKKLKLNNCSLASVPKLPKTLVSLELNNNFIQNIDNLMDLNNLKTVSLKENKVIPNDKLLEFKKYNPKCKIVSEKTISNFENEEVSYCNLNIKSIPDEILKYSNLKRLNLSGNPKLDLEVSLKLILPYANQLEELNLNGCGLKILPKILGEFKALQKITIFKENDRHLYYPHCNSFCKDNGVESIAQTAQVLAQLTNLTEVNFDFFIGFGFPEEILADCISKFQKAKVIYLKKFSYEDSINKKVVFDLLQLPELEEIHWIEWQEKSFETFIDELFIQNSYPNIKKIYWKNEHESMPNQFVKFSNLEYLYSNGLNENFFEFSDKLQKLKYLETKTTYDQPIFPGKFGKLKNLEYAQITNCKIDSFENAFEQLSNLKKLEISTENRDYTNDLCFTNSVENLKNLESFTLITKYNHLINLSESFGKLLNLKELQINHGHGNHSCSEPLQLPESFCNLENLEFLKIEGSLKEFPISFSKIPNLKTLELDIKFMEQPFVFNKSFCEIKIEHLNIKGKIDFNYFEKVLVEMKNLKSLVLEGDKWHEPKEFSDLVKKSNLEKLTIKINDFYNYQFETVLILKGIAKFLKLKSLNFSYFRFTDDFQELTLFKNLEELTIYINSSSPYEELIEIISNYKDLKHLNLWNPNFKTLPVCFSKLTQIEKLTFEFHNEKTFGKEIYSLKNLKVIELFMCHFAKEKTKELKKNMPWVEVICTKC